ncbi:hypothetical protein PVAND_016006 [Polypedilum vanderplanki]|uniref:Leucine rich repeat protein n=1 Tax=Polypedilum vanderplanki TaxID=319348 RepID=A0A9J6BEC2_POLVA|nr:hypothetical protein PVAND_016006 [Polypedilum vanderplanki]
MKFFFIILQIIFFAQFVSLEEYYVNFNCQFAKDDPAKLVCDHPQKFFKNKNYYVFIPILYDTISQTYKSFRKFILKDFVMYYLPNHFYYKFFGLISLTISNTQLKEITQEKMKNFPELENLSIIHNDLTSIPSDLFHFNPNIKYIDLRYNKIIWIDIQMIRKFDEKIILDGNTFIKVFEEMKRQIEEALNGYCKKSELESLIGNQNKDLLNDLKLRMINHEIFINDTILLNLENIRKDLKELNDSKKIESLYMNIISINSSIDFIKDNFIQSMKFDLENKIETIEQKVKNLDLQNQENKSKSTTMETPTSDETIIESDTFKKEIIVLFILTALNSVFIILVIALVYRMRNIKPQKPTQQQSVIEMQPTQILYSDPNYDEIVACTNVVDFSRNENNNNEIYDSIWNSQNNSNDVYTAVDFSKKKSRRSN